MPGPAPAPQTAMRLPVRHFLIRQHPPLPREDPLMFAEGFMLMILGMSVVFIFLGLLVFTIKATSFVFKRIIGYGAEAGFDSVRTTEQIREENAKIAAIVASVVDYSREMSAKVAESNG